MNVQKKTVSFEVKSSDEDRGFFSAYVSTWTREPDSYGDVIARGAFTGTLAEWAESGFNIPVLWNHNDFDPNMFLGHVTKAVEDDRGLYVDAVLDLDNPTAKQVYRTIKNRRVNHMSFAFRIKESEWITEDGIEKHELRELELLEVSIVPHPANMDTSIESVKAAKSFTDDQLRVLKEFSDQLLAGKESHTSEKEEADSNTETGDEAEGKSAVDVEAVARIKERIKNLTE